MNISHPSHPPELVDHIDTSSLVFFSFAMFFSRLFFFVGACSYSDFWFCLYPSSNFQIVLRLHVILRSICPNPPASFLPLFSVALLPR